MLYDYQIREEDRPLIISKLTEQLKEIHNQTWRVFSVKHAIWMLHRRVLFGGISTYNLYRVLLSIRKYNIDDNHIYHWELGLAFNRFITTWLVELGDRIIPRPISWYTSLGKINEDNPYDEYNRADSIFWNLDRIVETTPDRYEKPVTNTPYWAQLQNKYGRQKHL